LDIIKMGCLKSRQPIFIRVISEIVLIRVFSSF
jgi:hypothetical protein